MHRVLNLGSAHQRRGHHNTTLDETLGDGAAHSPGMGFPTNNGLLILDAGDNCGDDVTSAADVAGDS